ncbi:hypothetical protein QS306_11570 [Paraburkholderia bonniea]|uniref:hypothetical protein n=1 Tax=Paraburkholderia bonniea TaxID=2152891 RepID=UPI002573591E|nr:hypothetical protein [Paraburkholderia bonniea]WJF89736.1 hypothetical protein QS306_11570 [Paraburkholderia bonniea]WJF93050.1 hypothetical protein QS308_11580 [Paraburkholderia bonniea]
MAGPSGYKKGLNSGAWHVSPFAKKLTRRHRDVARVDTAFAQALRAQTLYPQRIDALVAGGTYFIGNPCKRCGSVKRRVFDCGCWSCKQAMRPIVLDGRNRLAKGWLSVRSRDGHAAILDAKRREATGEFYRIDVGDWSARVYPTGRLAVHCHKQHIDTSDLRAVPKGRLFELGTANPELVEIMRRAGWSVD